MLALARFGKNKEKTAYDHVIDLMDLDPEGWSVQGESTKHVSGITVWHVSWDNPWLQAHRGPTKRERRALIRAMDRLAAAKIQKVIDERT